MLNEAFYTALGMRRAARGAPPPSFQFGSETWLEDGDRFIGLLRQHQRGHTSDYKRKRVASWQSTVHLPWALADGSPIYSQTDAYCSVLHLSGMAAAPAAPTLVVEMGTLLGHSSRCLAAGLASRSPHASNSTLFVAFDFFTLWYTPLQKPFNLLHPMTSRENALTAAHKRLRSGEPYDELVWRDLMVRPVYGGLLQAVPGDIERSAKAYFAGVPPTAPVNIWSIDSAKNQASFARQAAPVWPRLVNGSIIHLLDNAKQQLYFFFTQFVITGEVEAAYVALPFTLTCKFILIFTCIPAFILNPSTLPPSPPPSPSSLHLPSNTTATPPSPAPPPSPPPQVEVAYLSFTSSPWSFVVRRAPLPWYKVTGYGGKKHYTPHEWALIDVQLDLLIRRLAREYQADAEDVGALTTLIDKVKKGRK